MGVTSKTCPTCGKENNPTFNECWQCHYSFEDGIIRASKNNNLKTSRAEIIVVVSMGLLALLALVVGGPRGAAALIVMPLIVIGLFLYFIIRLIVGAIKTLRKP